MSSEQTTEAIALDLLMQALESFNITFQPGEQLPFARE